MSTAGMGALQRRCLYVAAGAVLLSGTAWLALHYFGSDGEALTGASRSAELWAMRIHGAAASAVLVALGSVLGTHVPAAWRKRVNAATGTALLAAALLLAATGWALYYTGDEALRSSMSVLHWAPGLAAAPPLASHARRKCTAGARR